MLKIKYKNRLVTNGGSWSWNRKLKDDSEQSLIRQYNIIIKKKEETMTTLFICYFSYIYIFPL